MVDVAPSASDRERVQRIRDNYHAVRERAARAAARAGRASDSVRVMAVTKNFPREHALAAVDAGLDLLGENRVQEAAGKHADRARPYELHLVGHLQRNKARDAARLFDAVQSIDAVPTAAALERRCAALDRTMAILLELNASGEPTKAGYPTGDALLRAAAEIAAGCPHLALAGVMTIGAHSDDEAVVRASFARLRAVHERLLVDHPHARILSMGMSQDFELAIEEGATLIRLGTALLGPRPTP
jgi:pyridoxal phosphate enzyme (YggS family)